MNDRSIPLPFTRRAASVLVLALLAACGGGGGSTSVSGVGVGGTGAFTLGPISGFGSIIVNGVRYDETSARILDDDGNTRQSSELKLGMKVELRASQPVDDGTGVMRATATEIRFNREVTGPITAVNATAGTLTVFGVVVKVDNSTVFDGATGLAALQPGNVVEVYALTEADGTRLATRIELKATAAANAVQVVNGSVTAVDVAARSFRIGASTFIAANALPADLIVGVPVRVVARPTSTAGSYEVVALQVRTPAYQDGITSAEIEGFVTEFTSNASFKVNGLPVTTSASTAFTGSGGSLAVGTRVEVEGKVSNGVLAATKVEIKRAEDTPSTASSGGASNGGSTSSASSDAKFELSGTLASVDLTAKSFVLRGNTVTYDANTVFDKGSTASLVNGRKVEVKAVRATDATKLLATRIQFEN